MKDFGGGEILYRACLSWVTMSHRTAALERPL